MLNLRRRDWESLPPTVCGWGINDVDYTIHIRKELPRVGGKRKFENLWTCPYYEKWCGMIHRCYSGKYQEKYPTYKGCVVCDEWKYLSNFIKWVDSQPNREWREHHLDKDLLVDGKLYSPHTCAYLSEKLNLFL